MFSRSTMSLLGLGLASAAGRRKAGSRACRWLAAVVLAALAGLMATNAQADIRTWDNGNANLLWGDEVNWDLASPGNGIPGPADTATFTAATGVGIVDLGGVTRTIDALTVTGFPNNSTTNYTFTNGTLTLNSINPLFDGRPINMVISAAVTDAGGAGGLGLVINKQPGDGGYLTISGKITISSTAYNAFRTYASGQNFGSFTFGSTTPGDTNTVAGGVYLNDGQNNNSKVFQGAWTIGGDFKAVFGGDSSIQLKNTVAIGGNLVNATTNGGNVRATHLQILAGSNVSVGGDLIMDGAYVVGTNFAKNVCDINISQAITMTSTGSVKVYGGALKLNVTDPILDNLTGSPDTSKIFLLGNTTGTTNAMISIDTAGKTLNNPITVQSGGTGQAILYSGATGTGAGNKVTYAGDITLNKDLSINANNTASTILDVTGRILGTAGTQAVTINSGAQVGTVSLSGANTYTGSTTISTGKLNLSTFTGGSAFSDFTINSAVTLAIDSASGTPVASVGRAQSVALNNAILTVAGTSAGDTDDVITNALSIGSGSSTITLTPDTGKNAALTAGSFTRTAGGIVLVRGTNLGVNTIAGKTLNSANIAVTTAPTFTGSTATSGTQMGILPWAIGDTSATGTGTDFLTHDATYGLRFLATSEVVTTFANLNATLDNARITTAITGIDGVTSLNSLNLGAGGSVDGTGTLTLASGGIVSSGATTGITTTGGGGTLAFGAVEGIVLTGTGSSLTIGSAITGSAGLTKVGDGTLILSGANGYNGPTTLYAGTTQFAGTMAAGSAVTINGGTAQLGAPGGLPADSTITFGPSSTGKLQLNGYSVTIGALNTNATVGTPIVENGVAGTVTLTVNNASGTSTFGGKLQNGAAGTLALTKDGAGTLTVSNSGNTFNGGIVINGGTLALPDRSGGGVNADDGILGAAPVSFQAANITINNGGVLQLASGTSGSTTYNANRGITLGAGMQTIRKQNGNGWAGWGGVISGTGGLIFDIQNNGFRPSAANTYTGDTRIISGGLQMQNLNALQNSTLDYNYSGNIEFQLTGDYKFGGLKGTKSLPNTLSATKTLSVGNNNQDTAYSGVISGTGAVITKIGTGTLTLTNTNTYTGATRVTAGTLLINGSTHASSAVSVANNVDSTTATLGGIGTINGSVTVNATAATSRVNRITGATIGTTGTLNIGGGLTFGAGAIGYFDITSTSVKDYLNVTGNLTADSGTIIEVSTGLPGGEYGLIGYTGSASDIGNYL
ncbi:MAG: autotransporter-associated beta strand repeat-containing protein, partial [Planctomycetota bacterium]|nr:autotransporter-associated beta strand repeat-containing protein [Planctomycetota bacterium]